MLQSRGTLKIHYLLLPLILYLTIQGFTWGLKPPGNELMNSSLFILGGEGCMRTMRPLEVVQKRHKYRSLRKGFTHPEQRKAIAQ